MTTIKTNNSNVKKQPKVLDLTIVSNFFQQAQKDSVVKDKNGNITKVYHNYPQLDDTNDNSIQTSFQSLISFLLTDRFQTSFKQICHNSSRDTSSTCDVDDVMQDTYILAITNLTYFIDYEYFFRRIKQFANNATKNNKRRMAKFTMSSPEKYEGFELNHNLATPNLERFSTLKIDIQPALNTMSIDDQKVFDYLSQGYSIREVSSVMNKKCQKKIAKVRKILKSYVLKTIPEVKVEKMVSEKMVIQGVNFQKKSFLVAGNLVVKN
jgi:DNA-directed RNA polymerase specialized sigma24 family protein